MRVVARLVRVADAICPWCRKLVVAFRVARISVSSKRLALVRSYFRRFVSISVARMACVVAKEKFPHSQI